MMLKQDYILLTKGKWKLLSKYKGRVIKNF